jgi:O-methyltransferase
MSQMDAQHGRDRAGDANSHRALSSQSRPAPGYLGQLEAHFQQQLAAERSGLQRGDCVFYHSVELPGGEVILGPWDLRGRESIYLGGVDFEGARVLEFGPASGALTYFMERHGATVVTFDVGYDVGIDLHPHPGNEDMRQLRVDHAKMIGEVQNSWWYLHREYESHAAAVYGNIYDLPSDLGAFDISVFAAILLHLRDPVAALEQAARRTRRTIVVTDAWAFGSDTLYENTMKVFPFGESGRWTVWWAISAGAIVAILYTLGFRDVAVTEHTQRHQFGHDASAEYDEMSMYTVVASR